MAAAVDFGFVRRLTARFYSHTGRPGLDPVVLFKMGLLGYLYGITSERRLAEEVRLHLAYRWFLGYDLDEATPDHSVLSKARARFGLPVYMAFFTEIVRQCERAGLVRGEVLYVDSTLVEANASPEFGRGAGPPRPIAGRGRTTWRRCGGRPPPPRPARATRPLPGTPVAPTGPGSRPGALASRPGRPCTLPARRTPPTAARGR